MMKHVMLMVVGMLFMAGTAVSQEKNFIDMPYVEVAARVDTTVTPDRIYLTIVLAEKDTKGKVSVEVLEQKMAGKLKELGINVDEQLTVADVASNFRKYFLKETDVLKSKSYSLMLYDARTAMLVVLGLEEEGISNVAVGRTEYSREEELRLVLKQKAMIKAWKTAGALLAPLDQRVGSVLHVSTEEVFVTGYAGDFMVRGAASTASKIEPLQIEFKKLSFRENIRVKFKIE